jgi:diguanylate cyclase (GGDEF)-like protein
MSLLRLFTITTTVLLLLIGLGLFRIINTEVQAFRATSNGLRAMQVTYKALVVAEKVSFERGPSNGVLGDGDRHDPRKRAKLAKARAVSDKALRDLDDALAAAPDLPQVSLAVRTMRRARAQLALGRAAVDRVANVPRAQRDPRRVMGAVHEMFDVVPIALDAATILSRDAEDAYPALSDTLVASGLAAELREYAGRLGSQFTAALTSAKPLQQSEEYGIYANRGRIDELHGLIAARLQTEGTDPRVLAAQREVESRYFGDDMAFVASVERASAERRPYGIDTAQFAARYVPAMGSIVALRDVLFTVATENAQRAYGKARRVLAIGCSAGLVTLCIVGGVLLIVRSRVVRPLLVTTTVLTDIASGNLDTVVPRTKQRDEIGKMLAAVVTLKENSVQKQLLEVERQRLIEELRVSSSTDYLTGLLNRRAFTEAALHEVANAVRYARPFAVVMFDIDHFKAVNDRCGHDAGDAVIAAVAACARDEFRKGDLVCRYGGEEFAVLAPECGLDDARVLTERVRAAVEALAIAVPGGSTVRVTASFGALAVPPGAGVSLDGLLHGTDEALYRAKAAGRNRVVIEPAETTSAAVSNSGGARSTSE